MTVEVQNIGNEALILSGLSYPTDFPEATGDSSACTSTISLTPAEQCDLPIDFVPKSSKALSEAVGLTDNALNVAGATQSIAVSGTGTPARTPQTITFTAPPLSVIYGVGAITLSATGGASYEICPSCGFQFGVSDDDAGISPAEWRAHWIRDGMKWSSQTSAAPPRWQPQRQLTKAKLDIS